ncbi:uncharacterized protein LOC101738815 isoform X2 [Bombyx mori]|nr:uncharacterized protein LOC101738815 isoform X2 [Bombyx mori]
MENKKAAPATQQPFAHQHLMAHHVHPNGMYSQHHPQLSAHLTSTQTDQIPPNGVMHQLLQSQYHSNLDARSPLLENRHEQYGSAYCQNQDYGRQYGVNDNYNNYQQSPPRPERSEVYLDHNVNSSLNQNISAGYNVEVYQDYLKRNPPKDSNQIYQNHQPTYRPNANQYSSKPYLPYSNRIGPQSNTELLRKQYNEIQQMKLQQQIHYQNQAQMHQQQKFAERQLLLQQIHGVQPPPNLQNSIYSDSSYRDLDRYSSKNDYKDYSSPETPKDIEKYEKNNDYREVENRNRQYQEPQWQHNQQTEYREQHEVHKRLAEGDKGINKPSNSAGQNQKNNVVSPMKSTSESSSPSVKSPSSESRRSSSGTQALRSPTAQRIPSAPVTVAGILYKQGSDGLKVWRKRWFVLSEYCLFYYKSQEEEKLLGSVLLPSYKVSVCTAEDKVLRKFAFKLEHANMRTYVLAAPDQEAMMKWMKALTMAAVMQTPNDPPHSRNDLSTTKAEDGEDIPMYANAPPKPRRSNEGFNSPSPDMYDPNYDLLKKPASHYSQSINHIRNQEHNYSSTTQDQIYTQSPQSPSQQQRTHHQKRPYDSHNLSLPLTNIAMDRLENEPSTSTNDFNSRSFDRSRGLQDQSQEQRNKNEQIYERQPQKNPFLHGPTPKTGSSYNIDMNAQNQNYQTRGSDIPQSVNRDDHSGANLTPNPVESARDLYGELDSRVSRSNSAANERLLMERRTPDAYGRSTTMSSYNKEKTGDYEDIYGIYGVENDYGKMTTKSSSINETKDNASSHQHQLQHNVQEKTFSGPSVLRKKKMQSSGIQPPMPRPHSADFLEYEAKNEMKNKSMPTRTVHDQTRQPQRPKSSLDINSYYDPSSETYYSEESYAEKMRQSVQYLQQGMRARNMEIPLAKYASGLAQKQLSTAYSQITNHNYNPDLNTANRLSRDQVSHSSKSDVEAMNSNWTLKEKNAENQKDYMNRSGSVMSDGSNASAMVKDASRYDPNGESFLRSASARLPSATEKEGDKKVQQREESMKRLLEWKQRMLQSPLTRKSTPATISLARSLNQSRQSLRSDQYKPKTFSNASYNSYSSDDEEGTPGTDLQNPSEVQAGRSHKVNVTSPNAMQSIVLHAPCDTHHESYSGDGQNITNYGDSPENIYENILCTISLPNIKLDEENDYEETDHLQNNENDVSSLDEKENGYETHESEAESETQEEYTDNDLDEVLLESECEASKAIAIEGDISNDTKDENAHRSITPVCFGESHYLPMSPRKMSIVELPQTTFPCLSELRVSNPHNNEDNPYVEMNIGSENEDTQTYEVLCVNNEKIMEPVYMELTNVRDYDAKENSPVSLKLSSDVASNFADTKEQTLKRASKMAKKTGETDGSDAEIETLTDTSLETPFNRFSISDTFRPASYYLSGSNSVLDVQDVTENEQNYPPLPSSSPPCDELSDDALSKYILEKLDQSNMSNDNSILKMLTTEKQKMSTLKRKTTSLMIYGSPTSIHDTLSRGEKVRHNRATLLSERNKVTSSQASLLKDTDYCYQSSSIDTDSLRSFNAEKGSSRLSLESDISSKFEVIPSSASSEVNSLNESDLAIDFRNPHKCNDVEMMNKRRPLSDDSLFELVENEFPVSNQTNVNVDLDKYLDNLQPCTSTNRKYTGNAQATVPTNDVSFIKDNAVQAAFQSNIHTRCSSTPVRNIGGQIPSSSRSQSPCSSTSITKAPISYYSKQYNEEEDLAKNLNHDETLNKIKEFENEKSVLRSNHDRNASSSSTGFHSRESSTEQSAPYYYSDLSSQEHVNILPTSHYLKNTNLHRKLNNQRRRGPLLKKTEISHIHNPIRKNQVMISDQSFDLVASARSVSVEFLSAADKDPEIDVKNIYESTARKHSKISESMSLISTLGCKSNLSNAESIANKSTAAVDPSSLIKLSSTSMSSHCSENSSNTVYYDAEADNIPYENVLCHGEKHWDEDSVWRDNLRRVSHRHARSMDDLDTVQPDANTTQRNSLDSYVTNSLKRIQKNTPKITRHVTYVNYTFHARTATGGPKILTNQKQQKLNDNDVYVSLAENAELPEEDLDEGVYEQLAIENRATAVEQNKKRFEIDREKLRQWDLMSSGLMKRVAGRVRNIDARLDTGEVARNSDTGTDNAGREGIL